MSAAAPFAVQKPVKACLANAKNCTKADDAVCTGAARLVQKGDGNSYRARVMGSLEMYFMCLLSLARLSNEFGKKASDLNSAKWGGACWPLIIWRPCALSVRI